MLHEPHPNKGMRLCRPTPWVKDGICGICIKDHRGGEGNPLLDTGILDDDIYTGPSLFVNRDNGIGNQTGAYETKKDRKIHNAAEARAEVAMPLKKIEKSIDTPNQNDI